MEWLIGGGIVLALLYIMGLLVVYLVPETLIGLAGFLFWIWMIIEAATQEPSEGSDKIVWVLLVVLLPVIGSLMYFFIRRPQRIARYGR